MSTETAPVVTDAATPPPAATTTTPEQRPALADNVFSVPDEWKEKPWASKIKSEEDVYKQIDSLSGLVGKKTVVPDFDKAQPEEIEEYFTMTRPQDKTAYKFGEGADEIFTGAVGDIFLKNGVSAYQGNKIIEGYQAYEKTALEEARSADGFKAEMTKSFGEKFDVNVSAVVKEHKAHLSTEDQALMDSMPNTYLGAVYRLTSALQKAYGASETGAAAEGGGAVIPQDHDAALKEINAKIAALDVKPHSQQEKDKLISERHQIFVNKISQGKK